MTLSASVYNVVTGRYDLILVVFLKEGYELLEFYTEEVAQLEDVQFVEKSINHQEMEKCIHALNVEL